MALTCCSVVWVFSSPRFQFNARLWPNLRDQFAAIQLALRHLGRPRPRHSGTDPGFCQRHCALAIVIVVLGFLHLEVQVHPLLPFRVTTRFPLIQLAAVVVKFVITVDKRPHVVAVSARVVGEERKRVAAFARGN